MIIYLKNSEIDRELWDNCIKNSGSHKPYAYSWYLDIVAPGWEALVDDDYDSVFPVPCSARFGIRYAALPAFIHQLGAFSPDKPASDVLIEFLDYMPGIFKMIDLCIGQNITYSGYKVTERLNCELSLSSPYEKLWERFTPECRRYISNISRKRFELTEDVTPEELAELSMTDKLSAHRKIKYIDYERIKELMHYCINKRKGKIIGVRTTRKRLIFGVFLVHIRGSVTILLTAETTESREKHTGYYVINEIIKEYSSTAAILDFACRNDGSDESPGRSFGSTFAPYFRIYRNRLLWPVRLL